MDKIGNTQYLDKLDKLDREPDLATYWAKQEQDDAAYYGFCSCLALAETQLRTAWQDTPLEALIKHRWPDMYAAGPSDRRFELARVMIGHG